MTISGVVMNGRVEFTEAADLPDGTEVLVDVMRSRKEDGETREEFLQSLRESHANAMAGIGLMDADVFLEEWGREIDAREAAERIGR